MKNILILILTVLLIGLFWIYSNVYRINYEYNYINLSKMQLIEILPFRCFKNDKMQIILKIGPTHKYFDFREDIKKDKYIMSQKKWGIYLYEKENFWRKGSIYIEIVFDENEKVISQNKSFTSEGF